MPHPTIDNNQYRLAIRAWAVAICLAALLLGATNAAGAAVMMTYEADQDFIQGSDPGGLDGSHVVVELAFAEGQRYEAYANGPGVQADFESAVLTISGASQPSSNGTFTTMVLDGGIVIGDLSGHFQFFIGSSDDAKSTPMVFDLPLVNVQFNLFLDVPITSVPSPGDPIRASDFPTTPFSARISNHSHVLLDGTDPFVLFSPSNEQFSIVPEPGSLALLGLGGAIVALRRPRLRVSGGDADAPAITN